ncbi:energy transducer TonB [Sphingomonas abietis]|uniref:Energy transducer TonB n=1 Tax=Sphingomonas abietis TaxID=3012344 RepID=A0ABY7NNJ7_9SPHN|nr:energy transducer TonB [Sphingomonas abietis]WBO22550.1 energy transducer TonB [Sphingomonas abietis]
MAVAERVLPVAWERSAYQASRRFQIGPALASLLMVAGLLSGFLWLNVTPNRIAKHDLLTISLAITPPPPPKQPPAPLQKQVTVKPLQPAIVAPPPVVTVPAPPSPVATAPVPTPPRVIVAPAAPAAPVVSAAPPATPADGGDLSSKMIFAKPPSYPIESRRLHEEGTVVLAVLLSAEGQVAGISIAQSSGSDRLDQAALAAVRKWRWAPIVRNGQPVMVQGQVRMPFVLKH